VKGLGWDKKSGDGNKKWKKRWRTREYLEKSEGRFGGKKSGKANVKKSMSMVETMTPECDGGYGLKREREGGGWRVESGEWRVESREREEKRSGGDANSLYD
jgi:hypothetical protein